MKPTLQQLITPVFTWEKGDTRDEWTLLMNGEPVADLARNYPRKWGGAGRGQVNDTSKPMQWTLAPWGPRPSTKPCPHGTPVSDAKKAAEAIVRGWQ